VTGTPGATRVLTITNVLKTYTVINGTTNIIQVKTASGVAFNCPPSATTVIACDGLNGVQGSGIAPLTSPAFTGVPTAPTAAVGTNTTQLATTAFVQAAIPTGVILLWSGSIASIPAGWALCDGTAGTPNLRDRFVVGAGTTYAVNDTGGANTVTLDTTQIPSHTHTGTTAATDLSHTHTGSGTSGIADLSHTHTGSGTTGGQNANHGHSGSTDTQGTHAHSFYSGTFGGSYNAFPNDEGGPGNISYTYSTATAGAHNHNVSTGIQNADHGHAYSFTTSAASIPMTHTHSFSFLTSGASVVMNHTHSFTSNATGGGASHENRPPYFALAYIMKV
jgi:microcystin-dependent protein